MDRNSKKQNIITYFGYLWLLISVFWTLYQILDYSYNLKDSINVKLVFVIIVSLSILLAAFLLTFFPSVLNFFFNRLPDEDKYFRLQANEKNEHYKNLLNTCLLHIDNDLLFLEPLNRNISTLTKEAIIKTGSFNSRILLKLGKHDIRVINGLILYNQLIDTNIHDLSLYYLRCHVLINDLGWSLYCLDQKQVEKIIIYAQEMSINFLGLDIKNYKTTAINNINQTIHQLENLNKHHALICQGYRHLISLNELSHYSVDSYIKLFEQNIQKIKSKCDRRKMLGNLYYLQAEKMLKTITNENSRDTAINYIKKAIIEYTAANDTNRLCKTFSLKGRIYLEFSHNHDDFLAMALTEFFNGYRESVRINRMDEQLKNLYYITALMQQHDEIWKEYVMEGIRLASISKNSKYLNYFQSILPARYYIFIRHGESEKNINNLISGEGNLTEYGKLEVSKKIDEIKKYLQSRNIEEADITIYGHKKAQVTETIQLLSKAFPLSTVEYSNLLRPTDLGCLKGKSELELVMDKNYIMLQRWRNHELSVRELNIEGAESPENYWNRAIEFINLSAKSKCSIVICTTSVAILFTNYILNQSIENGRYRHFDIPLCGTLNCIKINEYFEIINKDTQSNINFFNCVTE